MTLNWNIFVLWNKLTTITSLPFWVISWGKEAEAVFIINKIQGHVEK